MASITSVVEHFDPHGNPPGVSFEVAGSAFLPNEVLTIEGILSKTQQKLTTQATTTAGGTFSGARLGTLPDQPAALPQLFFGIEVFATNSKGVTTSGFLVTFVNTPAPPTPI